jgi:cystathionine gamma-synthase
MDIETRVVRGASGGDPVTGAVSFPIYQSATFSHPALGETTGWDYSRQANPTRTELESTIALLEGGTRGFAFSTGMAAIAAALDLLSAGDHVVYSEDLYGGTYRLADMLRDRRNVDFSLADTRSLESVAAAWRPSTRLLVVETPSNPMSRVSDIAVLSEYAHSHGALVMVDNTFLSPLFQRPLSLGADLVIHSGTKFLAGHNDTLAGFLVCADEGLSERLVLIQKTTGAVLAPFDCWLCLRGIKTLSVRMERQQANALTIARWLVGHPAVESVHYVGLEDHPDHSLSRRQATGFGSMISFRMKDPAMAPEVLRRVRVVTFAESLGGVESLITFPMVQTHAAIPEELRLLLGVDERLLRLSVGIESAADLIADLAQALA